MEGAAGKGPGQVCRAPPAPGKLDRVKASPDALVTAARDAARERRWDDAAALLEEALGLEPRHLSALDMLGYVRFFQARYVDAEQACRAALAVSPDHAYAHKGLGLCLARQGQLDEGVASLERAIALAPDWLDPYWDLAIVSMEARQLEAALLATRRGAQAVPAARARLEELARRIEQELGRAGNGDRS